MKVAFVADTPYQIMNCIIFASTECTLEKHELDIYIGLQFSNDRAIADRLEKTNLFSNVFLFEPDKIHNRTIGTRIVEIAHPEQVLKQLLISENCYIKKGEYVYIYLSIFTKFSVALICESAAKVIFYDDGIGNYLGNTWQKGIPYTHKVLYALLGKNPRKFTEEKRYVISKTLWSMVGNSMRKIEEMPSINNDVSLKYLYYVFDYKSSKYYLDKKIVYLTQPVTQQTEKNKKVEIELIDEVRKKSVPFLIRPHPRDNAMYKKEEVDVHKALWELICLDQISESHVLIGMFSTAQFSPKVLYNKEVYLIFTYRLYQDIFSEDALAKIDDMVKKIRNTYKHSNKIFVPQTMREYKFILSSLLM